MKKEVPFAQAQHHSITLVFPQVNHYKDLYGYNAKACHGLHYGRTILSGATSFHPQWHNIILKVWHHGGHRVRTCTPGQKKFHSNPSTDR